MKFRKTVFDTFKILNLLVFVFERLKLHSLNPPQSQLEYFLNGRITGDTHHPQHSIESEGDVGYCGVAEVDCRSEGLAVQHSLDGLMGGTTVTLLTGQHRVTVVHCWEMGEGHIIEWAIRLNRQTFESGLMERSTAWVVKLNFTIKFVSSQKSFLWMNRITKNGRMG